MLREPASRAIPDQPKSVKYYLIQKLFSARLHCALGLLMLVLQRNPVSKLLVNAKHLQPNTPVARILQSFALPATALAVPHAVSGASSSTNSIYTVEYINTPEVKVGSEAVISFENSFTPQSWRVQGEIPPGMRITDLRQKKIVENGVIATSLGLIIGTPTQDGTYDLVLTPWSETDGTGETAPEPDPGALHLRIVVLPGESQSPIAPELSISRTEDIVTLSWSIAAAQGFELKTSINLSTWETVSTFPTITDDTARITFTTTKSTPAFYRFQASN